MKVKIVRLETVVVPETSLRGKWKAIETIDDAEKIVNVRIELMAN